jgi:MerR family transcriptional regulator, light-induced transcriptional regulator
MTSDDDSRYNIGAVSRLSGVSREKIRIWERRYGAVTPHRDDTNHRLYRRQDIERLSLIRRLVDRGHGVSSVATLSIRDLEARLQVAAGEAAMAPPQRALAVTAEGDGICRLLQELGVTTVSRAADAAAAAAWLETNHAELLIAEVPTLLSHDLPTLIRLRRRAPSARMLIVYRFASRVLLDQIRALGIRPIKAPLQTGDLHWAEQSAPPTDAPPADHRVRRYDPEQLLRAAGMDDNVKCECPRHLVDLIRDLCAFEDYSLGCEVESAGDAALHREVYDVVARARALVEDALGILADEEQLKL